MRRAERQLSADHVYGPGSLGPPQHKLEKNRTAAKSGPSLGSKTEKNNNTKITICTGVNVKCKYIAG